MQQLLQLLRPRVLISRIQVPLLDQGSRMSIVMQQHSQQQSGNANSSSSSSSRQLLQAALQMLLHQGQRMMAP